VADLYKPDDTGSQDQLAILRVILQRITQAEHPEKFTLIKQVVLQRVADVEEECAMPLHSSGA
jgi:hypothetical protein